MENIGIIQSIVTAFSHGGIWMWAIFVAQTFSFAIIAERIWKLYISRETNNAAIINAFESDIKAGRLESVIDRSRSLPKSSPIGRVVRAGARAALEMGGREEIQAQM